MSIFVHDQNLWLVVRINLAMIIKLLYKQFVTYLVGKLDPATDMHASVPSFLLHCDHACIIILILVMVKHVSGK